MMIIIRVLSSLDGSTNQSIYRDSKRLASKRTDASASRTARSSTYVHCADEPRCGPAGLRVDWRMGRRILAPSEPDTRTLLAAASSGCPSCLPPALALHGACRVKDRCALCGRPDNMAVWLYRRNVPAV
jgi:hypothetical protein